MAFIKLGKQKKENGYYEGEGVTVLSLVLNKMSSRHPTIWKNLEVRDRAKPSEDRWRQRPVTPRPPSMPLFLVMRCRLPW